MTSVINRMLCLVAVPFLLVPLANDAQRKKRQKVCSRSRRGRKVIVDKPISAKRDAKRAQPDAAFWVLRCERNSYTMRLSPDMAARIQRLK